VQNFTVLIVSAVKICKQCLQTPRPPTGASPFDPILGDSLGYCPQVKITVAATADRRFFSYFADTHTHGQTDDRPIEAILSFSGLIARRWYDGSMVATSS